MKTSLILASAGAAVLFSGCCCFCCKEQVAEIRRSNEEIKLDGKLTEKAWTTAPEYKLTHLRNDLKDLPKRTKAQRLKDPFEVGSARFLMDDKYLYIGIDFADCDVIAESDDDQTYLYKTGDLAEIFIKPVNARHYWELYVAPNSAKTSFFFRSSGLAGLGSPFEAKIMPGLKTAAFVNGTINNSKDVDHGWTAEMAVPLAELAKQGVSFNENEPWTIMVSRYNYSTPLHAMQYSSFPKLPRINYHLTDYYAPVKFVKMESLKSGK